MITELEAFEYECMGTWWLGYISPKWLQKIVARHIARKVHKKYILYAEYMEKKNGAM